MCETVRTAQDRTPVLCEMCEMPIGIALRTAFRTARHGYSVSHSGAGTLQLLQRKTVVRRCQTVNVPARREYRLTRRFPLRAQDGLSDDGHRLTDGLSDGRGLMQAARCMRAMGGAGSEVEAGPGGRLSAPMRQSCANRAPMLPCISAWRLRQCANAGRGYGGERARTPTAPRLPRQSTARQCGYRLPTAAGRSLRRNKLRRLEQSKLVKQARSGRWTLTEAGKKEAYRP